MDSTVDQGATKKVPITIITGFLGSGKVRNHKLILTHTSDYPREPRFDEASRQTNCGDSK